MTTRPGRGTRADATQNEPQQRGGGEQLDVAAEASIRLAHRALNRFPELLKRHKYVAGGAAVAGALVVLASVAIARRMRQGETGEQAAERVTRAEIESLHPRDRNLDEPAPEPISNTQASYSNGSSANGAATHGAGRRASES
jgi:hypothetical protein